jgi:hypothetical protein
MCMDYEGWESMEEVCGSWGGDIEGSRDLREWVEENAGEREEEDVDMRKRWGLDGNGRWDRLDEACKGRFGDERHSFPRAVQAMAFDSPDFEMTKLLPTQVTWQNMRGMMALYWCIMRWLDWMTVQ